MSDLFDEKKVAITDEARRLKERAVAAVRERMLG